MNTCRHCGNNLMELPHDDPNQTVKIYGCRNCGRVMKSLDGEEQTLTIKLDPYMRLAVSRGLLDNQLYPALMLQEIT